MFEVDPQGRARYVPEPEGSPDAKEPQTARPWILGWLERTGAKPRYVWPAAVLAVAILLAGAAGVWESQQYVFVVAAIVLYLAGCAFFRRPWAAIILWPALVLLLGGLEHPGTADWQRIDVLAVLLTSVFTGFVLVRPPRWGGLGVESEERKKPMEKRKPRFGFRRKLILVTGTVEFLLSGTAGLAAEGDYCFHDVGHNPLPMLLIGWVMIVVFNGALLWAFVGPWGRPRGEAADAAPSATAGDQQTGQKTGPPAQVP